MIDNKSNIDICINCGSNNFINDKEIICRDCGTINGKIYSDQKRKYSTYVLDTFYKYPIKSSLFSYHNKQSILTRKINKYLLDIRTQTHLSSNRIKEIKSLIKKQLLKDKKESKKLFIKLTVFVSTYLILKKYEIHITSKTFYDKFFSINTYSFSLFRKKIVEMKKLIIKKKKNKIEKERIYLRRILEQLGFNNKDFYDKCIEIINNIKTNSFHAIRSETIVAIVIWHVNKYNTNLLHTKISQKKIREKINLSDTGFFKSKKILEEEHFL